MGSTFKTMIANNKELIIGKAYILVGSPTKPKASYTTAVCDRKNDALMPPQNFV